MYVHLPNDLMVLDKERMKAENRDPQMCWSECAVSRSVPTGDGCSRYADFIPLGASATPSEDLRTLCGQ